MVLHLSLGSHGQPTSQTDEQDDRAPAGCASFHRAKMELLGSPDVFLPVYSRGRAAPVGDLDPGPRLPRRLNLSLSQKDLTE